MLKDRKILVVDDDADVRWMLVEFLESQACQVLAAEDADAMERILAQEAVDVILLDRTMPTGDALAEVPELRRRFNVGVIMLTALGDDAERLRGFETGADDYITKPFNWRELTARIGNVLRRLDWTGPHRPGPMPSAAGETRPQTTERMAAIMCADVASYVRLMNDDQETTLRQWWASRQQVVDPAIERHGGRIVKLTGDGFFAEFRAAMQAIDAAVEIQSRLAERDHDLPEERRMMFRLGLHVCSVVVDGEDIYGSGVNLAARLQTLARPGGVCASATVRDAAHQRVDLRFIDLGPHKLKNIAEAVQVYALEWPSLSRETIPGHKKF